MDIRRCLVFVGILLVMGLLLGDFSEERIRAICSDQNITADQVYEQLRDFADYKADTPKGVVISDSTSMGRPYYYYLPRSYDGNTAIPLIIWLHGGVGRPDYIDGAEYIQELGLVEVAETKNFALLFPLSRDDCHWWHKAGEDNVLEQLRIMKERFNIDDDRVYMTGFSDGGSGSFHFGFRLPDSFAALYPLNGMISVGTHMSGNPSYVANLRNRHLRVINTDEDGLYPAAQTRLTMNMALDAGADLSYLEYWGIGHSWDYFGEDFPLMIKDMQKRSRDSFKSEIYWECYSDEYNRCDWLEIVEIDTLAEKADWQQEYNVELPEIRISFGFYHDEEFKGEGVKVKSVIENSLAAEMGLHQDDIIIEMDRVSLANIDDLSTLKSGKSRGDEVSLKVFREGETKLLEGAFPDTMYYNCFFYNRISGAVKGKYYGNIFELETSRVGKLAIYIHPEMVNINIPVTVIVNGEKKFEDKVEYSKKFMEERALRTRDRKALWVSKIKVNSEQ
ncbi:MAG: PDZ domain-containing protein [Saprospiraceae bacterium]|nr:PDZ domain-containing protein [Saprospiraceae bacterium]